MIHNERERILMNMFIDNETEKESTIVNKNNMVFNIEDMMAPIDDTFDFLNVKVTKPENVVTNEEPKEETSGKI